MLADISPQSVRGLIVSLLGLLFGIAFILYVQIAPAIVNNLKIQNFIIFKYPLLYTWYFVNSHAGLFLERRGGGGVGYATSLDNFKSSSIAVSLSPSCCFFFRSSLIFWNAMFLDKNHCTKYIYAYLCMYVVWPTHHCTND